MNVFPGYISEGWRGFLEGIDQKPKAVWSCTFSSHRSGPLERFFRKGLTKSQKLSGATFFRVVAAGRLRGLVVGGKRQPEADGRKHFSGVHLRMLAGLSAGD